MTQVTSNQSFIVLMVNKALLGSSAKFGAKDTLNWFQQPAKMKSQHIPSIVCSNCDLLYQIVRIEGLCQKMGKLKETECRFQRVHN